MNPWKSFTILAAWLMRIAMMLIIFSYFFNIAMRLDLSDYRFFIAALFLVFGLLLFVGGFLSRHTMTVVSALVLLILSILQAYWNFSGVTSAFALWLLMCSCSLYFLSHGNK
jgi:hypothetical protein